MNVYLRCTVVIVFAALLTGCTSEVTLSVPDMMCEDGCAVKVHEILSKQPGAKDVIVDFEARTATVAIEEGVFDADAAVAALVDHGFDNSRLTTADGAKPQAAMH